jgi:hypothetical protein
VGRQGVFNRLASNETYTMHTDSIAGHDAPFPSTHPTHSPAGEQSGTSDEAQIPGQLAALQAENRELRAEIERLRSERNRMNDVQTGIMELLGTKVPERLLHDLRNVMNERELYRALADATA